MKHWHSLWLAALLVPWMLAGCAKNDAAVTQLDKAAGSTAGKSTGLDPEVQAARAKLSPEDQALVAAQEYCAIRPKNHLGSMGVPFKVMVKGQPVFLCCDGCQDRALADPEKTLAKVAELKAKHAAK